VLHGAECWTVKNQHENKTSVAGIRMLRWMCGKTRTSIAGIRMLRWMCGKTRQDKIRNDNIRES